MAVGKSEAVKLDGWDEFKRELNDIGKNAARGVIKQSLESAAKVVVEAAKGTTLFKDMTGTLRNSIAVKRRKNESTRIGPDVVATAPHAHLIEFGWNQPTAGGSREIPGTYFLTNALLENEEAILSKLNSEMRRFLERRMKRLAKKKAG